MAAPHLGSCFSLLFFVASLAFVVESFSDLKLNFMQVGQFKRPLGKIPIVTHPAYAPAFSPAPAPEPMELPREFDARTHWPHCSNIGRILDQGHCGSCWAFASVGALSDRFCVRFNMDISLSVNDILSCCGEDRCGGCNDGADLINAWDYLKSVGVVTEECAPYFDAVGCDHPGCDMNSPTPACARQCVDVNQQRVKYRAEHVSMIFGPDGGIVPIMMKELYENGPISIGFNVHEDFGNYTTGVYIRSEDAALKFGHAAKLIGWGTSDDGVDYWLVANQWNTRWGDDGFFKIKRGTNECGIEGLLLVGLPRFPSLEAW